MSKDSSAKNYQNNKKKTTKKSHGRDKSLSKEENEKKGNIMVVNNTKIYQKMKNKSLMSIEKNIK